MWPAAIPTIAPPLGGAVVSRPDVNENCPRCVAAHINADPGTRAAALLEGYWYGLHAAVQALDLTPEQVRTDFGTGRRVARAGRADMSALVEARRLDRSIAEDHATEAVPALVARPGGMLAAEQRQRLPRTANGSPAWRRPGSTTAGRSEAIRLASAL